MSRPSQPAMGRVYSLVLLGAAAALVMASCGGGGSGSTPTALTAPAAPGSGAAPNSVSVPPASARKSYGTTQLTLKLPTVFVGKKGQAVVSRKAVKAVSLHNGKTASLRTPAYVNPSSGNLIDIFVDGSLVYNLDGSTPNDSITVNPATPDGTQTVALPLFSNAANDVVVVEWDSQGPPGNDMLAVGELYIGTFQAGVGANPPPITLLMNLFGVGVLDLYTQNDPALLNGGSWLGLGSGSENSCSVGIGNATPLAEAQFGLYNADGLQMFVPVAGYGGTNTPTMTASSDNGGTTRAGQTGIPGVYQVIWDTNCDGVTVTATTSNPAFAIEDTTFGSPGGSYGYYYCYYYNENCPGGPYLGLWEFNNIYNSEPYTPQGYVFPQNYQQSIDIIASPPP